MLATQSRLLRGLVALQGAGYASKALSSAAAAGVGRRAGAVLLAGATMLTTVSHAQPGKDDEPPEPKRSRTGRVSKPPSLYKPPENRPPSHQDKSKEKVAAARVRAEEKRTTLADSAADSLAQFTEHKIECGLGPDMLAHIYAGGGFSADEKRQLLPLVTNLAPPEDDETWQASHHMHLTFHMLMTGQRKQSGLPLLLIAYNWLKERGLLDVWRCVAAQLVLRFGEGNPDHFDAQTGELVYQQPRMVTSSGKEQTAGLRLLLDIGELPDGAERLITFKLQQRASYSEPRRARPSAAQLQAASEQLSLLDGAVFMDDRASGSGGLGGLLHGRGGNAQRIGASLSLDLALAQHRAPGASGLWKVSDAIEQIIMFFHPTTPMGHSPVFDAGSRRGIGGGGGSGPGTAAERASVRVAAAAEELGMALPPDGSAAAEPATEDLHCYWCHTLAPGVEGARGSKPRWRGLVVAGRRRRLCGACQTTHGRDGLSGVRPAAMLCPGCSNCDFD